jgi:hypothetical protein
MGEKAKPPFFGVLPDRLIRLKIEISWISGQLPVHSGFVITRSQPEMEAAKAEPQVL